MCARQRMNREGLSPSGARIRSAVSKGGGNASLASISNDAGGQGVRREAESEGHAENHRAVIEGRKPMMNRSAKDREWSSPHYGGKGI